MAKSFAQKLRDQGFDNSYYDRSDGFTIARCSQCIAVFLNSIACHEKGCPNEKRE